MSQSDVHPMCLDETMTIWIDSETMKCFSNTCWLLLLLIVKIALRVSNIKLMRELVSVTRLLLSDSVVHKADEVSEMRLVLEIDDELDEVSEVGYYNFCEVREAHE